MSFPTVDRLQTRRRRTLRLLRWGLVLVGVALPVSAASQVLPSEPIRLAGGRLIIAGEVTGTVGPYDEGYFNYTDYNHSLLRMLRLGVTASLRAGDRVTFLWELRTENWDALRPYALYVRLHPWPGRPIDIQAGRIPPTFGAFARRSYGTANPLIGYPLIYQYLTSVRADAFPATADDLLRMRGRGWLARYPLGVEEPDEGLPVVSAFLWDTGVQVRIGRRPAQVAAAITNGSLSNPQFDDRNQGKQLAARLALQPAFGLQIGISAARGEYANRRVVEALPGMPEPLGQRALGFDVEYSRDHWIVRSEGVLSAWDAPAFSPRPADRPLWARGVTFEGRYTARPGLYFAGRVDRLTFSTITGTLFGGVATPWDAPVSRVEVGGGYYLQRNLVAKMTYQYNWRDGGFVRRRGYTAAQLLYWF